MIALIGFAAHVALALLVVLIWVLLFAAAVEMFKGDAYDRRHGGMS